MSHFINQNSIIETFQILDCQALTLNAFSHSYNNYFNKLLNAKFEFRQRFKLEMLPFQFTEILIISVNIIDDHLLVVAN